MADTDSRGFRSTTSVGVGLQYGGLLGGQFGTENGKHKLYAALGYIGIGGGYNYAVLDHVAVGLNAMAIPFPIGGDAIAFYGVNANYYFNSTFSTGWMIGLDVFEDTDELTIPGVFKALISFGRIF